jgi:NitT/TauT family transport system substrate-binding protein
MKLSMPAGAARCCTIALLLAISCVAQAQVKVSFASLIVNSSYLPLWVAQDQGIFARHGLDSEVRILEAAHTHIGAENHFGVVGVPAALIVTSGGQALKVLMPVDLPRVTAQLIARPGIKTPADLRGRRVGIASVGTGAWINTQLALDHFGMDAARDGISFVEVGSGAAALAQALDDGRVDLVAIDAGQAAQLTAKGHTLLLDFAKTSIIGVQSALVVDGAYLRERPDVVEKVVAAMMEAMAFSLAPANEQVVRNILAARMNLAAAPAAVDAGYRSFLVRANRRGETSRPAIENMQRVMARADPKILQVRAEDLVDDSFIRKLEQAGAIDAGLQRYGVK